MLFKMVRAYFRLAVALSKMSFHIMCGIWKIAKLKHAPVTIFGGTHLKATSIYMTKATQLAHLLASHGIPVLTGGGPGIMEAASCGALGVKTKVITSIGISVKGLESGLEHSVCPRDVIEMDNFGARKWLLIRYSFGFAVFPGGFGTMNELMELLTLIQTKKLNKAPIVLIGHEYWKPFLLWLQESALKNGLIFQEDLTLFTVTDDIYEAYKFITAHRQKRPFSIFE